MDEHLDDGDVLRWNHTEVEGAEGQLGKSEDKGIYAIRDERLRVSVLEDAEGSVRRRCRFIGFGNR